MTPMPLSRPTPTPTRSAAPAAVRRLPAAPGVYRFSDARGRVLYVGRAVDLRRRVGSYWRDLGDRYHLRRMVPQVSRIEAAVCDSAHEAAWLERNLLEASLPPWNRVAGGQEIPLYLVLSDAGLQTAAIDEPVTGRRFGPYLGGTQVRLAMAAVHRVLPLRYAAGGLSGADREMARVLGVRPADRPAVAAAVADVLSGEPRATAGIRTVLVARRDAAAAALGFEMAAAIQGEIEALDWILSRQRMSLPDPQDFDVYGWSASRLVHFAMRAGRIRTWRVRPCGRRSAAALLARTPLAWLPFAERNAELGAALAAE
jgi:excinuclease ABC subunit C